MKVKNPAINCWILFNHLIKTCQGQKNNIKSFIPERSLNFKAFVTAINRRKLNNRP